MILFRAKYADGTTRLIDLTKYAPLIETYSELWATIAREAAIAHQTPQGITIELESLEVISI